MQTRSCHSYDLVADMDFAQCKQGRVIVTTLLQTWILLSATRSCHSYDLVADIDFLSVQTRSCHSYDLVADIDRFISYDLVADMDFAQCNRVPG